MEAKLRNSIFCIFLIILSCDHADKKNIYPRHVGDIAFDEAIDNKAFQLCNGDKEVRQYMEAKEFEKAIDILALQTQENDLADVHFYTALCHKELNKNEQYTTHLEIAKKLYLEGSKAFDAYTHIYDKVYLKEIESELKLAKSL